MWTLKVLETDARGRQRWRDYRHPAGSKPVAEFPNLHAVRSFMRKHLMYCQVIAENQVNGDQVVLYFNGRNFE